MDSAACSLCLRSSLGAKKAVVTLGDGSTLNHIPITRGFNTLLHRRQRATSA